ncbi:MAG: HAMP domain-containing histidine kinase [Oscillospiraceae bacterium]|nr:HAMP domain-containing histidine kinase [Oscillospiraceae bacterium]
MKATKFLRFTAALFYYISALLCVYCVCGAVLVFERPFTEWVYIPGIFLWPLRNAYLPLAVFFGLLTLLLLLRRCITAAKREAGGLYRWPLDLMCVVYIATAYLLAAASVAVVEGLWDYYHVSMTPPWGYWRDILMIVLVTLIVCIFAALLCKSIAVQVKERQWLKGSLCWRVLRWGLHILRRIWSALGDFVRGLPGMWRLVGAAFIFCGFNYLCGVSQKVFFLLLALLADGAALWLLLRLVKQWRALETTTAALAEGDLRAAVDTAKFFPPLRQMGDTLNRVGLGLAKAVNERMQSERLKTELITNVSHDLKTPLTSIVSYVDLLKKEDIGQEPARSYIEVLDRQSQRLKKLTEDLVEASKASSGAMPVNRERLDLSELLRQCLGEYAERLSAAELTMVPQIPEGDFVVVADGRLLWRVLDNLVLNAAKYAQPGTRFYAALEQDEREKRLILRNISREPLNIAPEELMERFVRGDEARSSEGSGLGLSIARSLMELMGGRLSLTLDGDLFKVILHFPRE